MTRSTNRNYWLSKKGQKCDRCQKGYWNLNSGGGCEACMCHSIGSVTGECDEDTGDCVCLPGVGGTKCNQCLPNHYGMTREGCKGKFSVDADEPWKL